MIQINFYKYYKHLQVQRWGKIDTKAVYEV